MVAGYVSVHTYTVGSRFTTRLRPRIFGCKSNRRKTVLFHHNHHRVPEGLGVFPVP